MAALPSAIERDIERYAYRVYVTDTLQTIAENTAIPAAYYSGGKAGKTMTRRWADLDEPAKKETRTGKEIIEQLKAKADEIREGGGLS